MDYHNLTFSPLKNSKRTNWSAIRRANASADVRLRVLVKFDWLDPAWDVRDLADFLALIQDCPNLDFLLLTKRPELWLERLREVLAFIDSESELFEFLDAWIDCIDMPERGDYPTNVWIGSTAEDQRRADERIPELLKIPARVRFLSCEPLLGPVDFSDVDSEISVAMQRNDPKVMGYPADFIDWVICGGESGPNARPMHPDWARSLRDQCQEAGMPFFFKQWGEWASASQVEGNNPGMPLDDLRYGEFHYDTKFVERCMCDTGEPPTLYRVGKHRAGRLLDGREWNEFPGAAQ